ncbi:peptidoglycan DD-metalloendopeptidase family protein [Ornithinibacillus sp. L9]|uniref:Peptidoglycan DD-metalloendopeptidase family protein n=1 Tax=Ornithinibacillus caprae TaxID=2678566 RepID=A0A6N8FNG6_9BACI|nr:peptidoglycan DD-metalloendopeptidase family protein [Ornithinibacillus caprae]
MFIFILSLFSLAHTVHAEEEENNIYDERLSLYKKTEALTQIPWYYIAAIDQYERQIHKDLEDDQLISIQIPEEMWFGIGNSSFEKDVNIINMFNGKGKDGNDDRIADPNEPEDVLYTMANFILEYGQSEDDIMIGIWNFYKRDLAVHTIKNTAKVFKKFQDINLTDRDFPVAINYNYSYRNTWGDRRGFGGNRIHEGTDIFADYGTPVKSTTYGVVELKGWNLYGGWRIGIRDIYNIYHYYAHLSGYEEGVEVGQIVKPGDVLGKVGSTGYGPPGTSGKFPPHLHYGMYKDNGYSEWSFDPYPYLKKWERMAKQKRN